MKPLSPEDRQHVDTFLKRVRALLPTNQCTFVMTPKNKAFDNTYNLTHKQKIDIIRSITVDDFVEIKHNEISRYPDVDLYIFHKAIDLSVYGEDGEIVLYIKEYILKEKTMDMVIVISFHKEGLHDL